MISTIVSYVASPKAGIAYSSWAWTYWGGERKFEYTTVDVHVLLHNDGAKPAKNVQVYIPRGRASTLTVNPPIDCTVSERFGSESTLVVTFPMLLRGDTIAVITRDLDVEPMAGYPVTIRSEDGMGRREIPNIPEYPSQYSPSMLGIWRTPPEPPKRLLDYVMFPYARTVRPVADGLIWLDRHPPLNLLALFFPMKQDPAYDFGWFGPAGSLGVAMTDDVPRLPALLQFLIGLGWMLLVGWLGYTVVRTGWGLGTTLWRLLHRPAPARG